MRSYVLFSFLKGFVINRYCFRYLITQSSAFSNPLNSNNGGPFPFSSSLSLLKWKIQKQPSRGVLIKRCSENMQQIYRRTPMPKCDLNKVAKQLY